MNHRHLLLGAVLFAAYGVAAAQGFGSVSNAPVAAPARGAPPVVALDPAAVAPESTPGAAAPASTGAGAAFESGSGATATSLATTDSTATAGAAAFATTNSGPVDAAGAAPSLPFAGSSSAYEVADRILIEKGARRLSLFSGGRVIAEFPVRLGLNPYGHKQREGDFRTPEGTYYLSRRNPRSDFFLSVEVSYPSADDRARARRSGARPGGLIMIHGQPNVPRKPPDYYANNDWTDGCIAVSNSDMVDIWLRTRLGVPIEIRP